jgi:hypothetical protein
VQQVSATSKPEHEAGPDVEQPELILLNKVLWSAGLTDEFGHSFSAYGLASTKSKSVTMRRVMIISEENAL